MKIDTSTFQMLASHSAASTRSTNLRLTAWVGDRPNSTAPEPLASSMAALVNLSKASLDAEQQASAATALESATDALANDPKLQLIRFMVELMTGQTIHTLTPTDMAPTRTTQVSSPQTPGQPVSVQVPRAGFGLAVEARTTVQESEHTHFEASALVRTSDGLAVRVNLKLDMARSYSEETSLSLRLGDAAKKDPLVINFGGTATQLENQRFYFDLNGDGTAENTPLLSRNSGYLALDLNQNGRIDTGRELFGPATGQGFAELARYDQDGNGWIDEGDTVFKQLQVWTPAAQGPGQLQRARDLGVGALYLGSARTPFELRDSSNASLGAVRSTGVYLMENGSAGTLQQIDLTV